MEIPFVKMHGLGNNYIYLDFFQFQLEEKWLSKLAQDVSNVHTGIGSDGLILIHPSDAADLGMRIFNKDGSEGQSCGNGLRCTAKYAYETGIVAASSFTIETKAGIVHATVQVEDGRVTLITIDMGKPVLNRASIPMLGKDIPTVIAEPFQIAGRELFVTPLFMGNPNAVFFVERIEEAPLHELGPLIEKDSRFPEGVNVEFIEIVSETEMNFRVWERGSGATQACGTGACAAVVAAILNKRANRNTTIHVHLEGGDLNIKWDEHGHVWMTGGAEIVATGKYHFSVK
ncbi:MULTISPECIES: diaminopimelate epimerase [unclassified Virgibacillus]|uniref:diaminopimelate epimerase n=1 Tax=unclassified Virgibacillus TaxID=2620237 RepID=UPI0024DE1DE5|nr:diaminopimelate epimerase [Virgibacillus sp. LDC-1]